MTYIGLIKALLKTKGGQMPTKKTESNKKPTRVYLDPVYEKILDGFIPVLGSSTGEVIRSIIVEWVKNNIGFEKLEKVGAMRGLQKEDFKSITNKYKKGGK